MFWLILSVLLWGLVHSIMASLRFRAKLRNFFGEDVMRFYRLFFNIFSVITLIPVLWLVYILPDKPFYEIPVPWIYLTLFGQALSALGEIVGLFQTDVWEFAGLRQIIAPHEEGEKTLVIKGLYHYMRHPLYTFGLLFVWLTPVMSVNSLILYITLTLYIIVGVYFEERKLLREFGEAYAEYKKNTPMLIPRIW